MIRTNAERARLLAGEVHIWWVRPAAVDPADLARARDWMTPDERADSDRFAFAHLRRDHAVTRWLVRTALSRYAGVEPAAWQFSLDQHGRPAVAGPPDGAHLHFNLSHTRGMVVCAVADTPEVGVDVEDVTRERDMLAAARATFAADEIDELVELAGDRRRERFFQRWTVKEAYAKARGLGAALAFEAISVDLASPGAIRIAFAAGIDDDPARWELALLRPDPAHQVAVAAARRGPVARAFLLRPV